MSGLRDDVLDLWSDGGEVHFIATKMSATHGRHISEDRVRNILANARSMNDPRARLRVNRPKAGEVRRVGDIPVMTWTLRNAPWVQISLPYVSILGTSDHVE